MSVAAVEKKQRKTIAELYRLGMTPAEIHRSLKYSKTAISSVVKKEDTRGERVRRKRDYSRTRRDIRKNSSCRCCTEKKEKSVIDSDNKERDLDTSPYKAKTKTKAKVKKAKTWGMRAAFKRFLNSVTRKSTSSSSRRPTKMDVLGILVNLGFITGILVYLGFITWNLSSELKLGSSATASTHTEPREISWKGFVNDYLAHGIVEKLTLVNHKCVEFKMTNDSNTQVNRIMLNTKKCGESRITFFRSFSKSATKMCSTKTWETHNLNWRLVRQTLYQCWRKIGEAS